MIGSALLSVVLVIEVRFPDTFVRPLLARYAPNSLWGNPSVVPTVNCPVSRVSGESAFTYTPGELTARITAVLAPLG